MKKTLFIIFSILIVISISEIIYTNLIKKYPSGKILFLGDSLISRYDLDKYYKHYNTINSGVGGNLTNNILDDMENRVYKYDFDKVVLLVGTNDLEYSDLTNEDIKNNMEKIIDNIYMKNKKVKIYVESIYPINPEGNKEIVASRTNDEIKDLNKKIKDMCEINKCTYINVYDKLVDKNGNLKRIYMTDGLHLNRIGYIKVTRIIKKYIG